MAALDTHIFFELEKIEPSAWDRFSAGKPFQSYTWYRYGEKVLSDCQPMYVLVYRGTEPVARAAFWLIKNEPLPIQPALVRNGIQAILRRWPLLICRSPLASLPGLILPDMPDVREQALQAILAAARGFAQEKQASFIMFDFLGHEAATQGWPAGIQSVSLADPGTFMPLPWPDFDAYLASRDKDDRYHYRRSQRKAADLGIRVSRSQVVSDLETAEALIRKVETRFGAAPNPWIRLMLARMNEVDATWLEAHIDDRLVGCGLILRDGGAQVATALGLADDAPYVYFSLAYENLRLAFENKINLLRLGSGAYDIKKRLGFQIEDNAFVAFTSPSVTLQKAGLWLGKFS